MLTFFKILLAVLIVGLLMLLAGFFWLKRKFGGAIQAAMRYQKVCPHIVARERLVPSVPEEDPEGLDENDHAELWDDLRKAGFAPLTELGGEQTSRLRVARHADTNVVAALHDREDGRPFVEYYLLTDQPFGYVMTTDPRATNVSLPKLEVTQRSDLRPVDAIERLNGMPGGRRALDAQSFITFYERVFAMRADAKLSRPPELADLRAYAATVPGVPSLTDSEWESALAMSRKMWRIELEIALKDNGRRQLDLSDSQWQRIEDQVVVLHRALDADEVIALYGDQEILHRLGAQLKRQSLAPLQIFDEINRRRDEAVRHVLLTRVQSPVDGALYVPKAVRDAFAGKSTGAEGLA